MASIRTIVLCSGGLRSLVAAALVRSWPETGALTLLHVARADAAAAQRATWARRQADHFGQVRYEQLDDAPVLAERGAAAGADRLARSRRLLAAVAHAAASDAGAVVWPASYDGDVCAIARASEQAALIRQIAAVEIAESPQIDTPLMEFSDRQIIELGAALDVPWELARSCDVTADVPCGQCAACRRRRAAFDAARIVDPLCEAASR